MPRKKGKKSAETRRRESRKRMQKHREDPQVRERENAARRRLHSNPQVRERENEARRQRRSNPQIRERENEARRQRRLNPQVRQDENEARQRLRSNPQVRENENEARQELRLDPQVLERENAARQRLRSNPQVRERENEARQELRLDSPVRERENEGRRMKRSNFKVRKRENEARRHLRSDSLVRETENETRRSNHNRLKKFEDLVAIFLINIQDGPHHECGSCDRYFFKTSIKSTNFENLKRLPEDFLRSVILDRILLSNDNEKIEFCSTCYRDIMKMKAPKFCIKTSNLAFPVLPDFILNLESLEERLVAPRIPFMKIHTLGCDGQKGLKGAIVLVPCSVQKSVEMIPMVPEDTQTIQIKLKRKMEYKHHYQYESIRPKTVLEAAEYLVNQELYKEMDITLDSRWESYNLTEFIVDRNEISEGASCSSWHDNIAVQQEKDHEEQIKGGTLQDNEADQVDCQQVTLFESGIEYAPGEGEIPLPLLKDKYCEELAFPSIWGGHKRNEPTVKISYDEQIKSELRRSDRRAVRPDHILFVHKKSQCKQLQGSVNIALKKSAQNHGITALQAMDSGFISNTINMDNAYRFLAGITGSPAYWEARKKDVLAMVRQFGIFTFFITLSAAESHWPELLKILIKTVGEKNKIAANTDVSNLSWDQKTKLIQSDPVTCALYFNHRFQELKKTWTNVANGPFEEFAIKHSFYRIEFQHRGSPHVHMVVWLENAPKFDPNNSDSFKRVEDFIDRIVTTSSEEPSTLDYVKYQQHKCTHTCKRKNQSCRFGAPFMPMPNTKILTPFTADEKKDMSLNEKKQIDDQISNIRVILKSIETSSIETFKQFLEAIPCNEEQYIIILRYQLNACKIFIKREPKDCRVNPYCAKILSLMRSNMDIQFVLDPYACIGYIVDYINKSSRGLSLMLRTWLDEFKKGDSDLRKQLKGLANVFYNGTEISAQEAAWCRLGLPMSRSSVVSEFINTSPISKRQRLLKSRAELLQLDPDSTDIMQDGAIERYVDRPDDLEDICLAEFIAWYTFSSSGKMVKDPEQTDIDDDLKDNDEQNEEMTIKRKWNLKKGTLTRRKKPKVIRFVRFDINKDRVNHFRELCMLYKPWRRELEEIENQDCEALFEENAEAITLERNKYTALPIDFREILREIEEQRSNDVETRETDDEAGETFLPAYDYDENTMHPNLIRDIGLPEEEERREVMKTFTIPDQMNKDKFFELCNSLNLKQRDYLMHIISEFKLKQLPIYHYIAGKAGVGKSRLINAIYQSVIRLFRQTPGPVSTNEVLLIAYTGKAAHNIGGMTAHSAFSLLISQNTKDSKKLSPETKNTLRVKLRNMKLLIIDEISMLGTNTFFSIHERLCQIFDSSEPFAGKSVIVLGDFKQLRPVGDSYVFKPRKEKLASLVGNYLWENFKYFELTEIMRQKDDLIFAEALGRMSEGLLTARDIKMFETRVFQNHESLPEVAKKAIHLFRTNIEVDEYNLKRVNELRKEGDPIVISKAIDRVVGILSDTDKNQAIFALKTKETKDTYGLPHNVNLLKEVRYMVTTNIEVADGLFNGATGILHFIDHSASGPHTVWIKFDDTSIGAKARSLRNSPRDEEKINSLLTPLLREKKTFQVTKKGQAQICREQFPLVIAEGMTVHKSQGASMTHVVVQPCRMDRALLYVASSRATNLEGLYYIGKFNPPKAPAPTDEVVVEMKRMKAECLLIPKFVHLRNISKHSFQIISQNVRSLRKHIESIKCDQVYTNSHVMLFQETWNVENDNYRIESFKEIVRNLPQSNQPAANGTIIFAKEQTSLAITNEKRFEFRSNDKHIEITLCNVENITLINIYKNPASSFEFFKEALRSIEKHLNVSNVLICGDFNSDFASKDGEKIEKYLHKNFRLKLLSRKLPTTDSLKTIDAAFGNLQDYNCEVIIYETIFSDHKPIVIKIVKKSSKVD